MHDDNLMAVTPGPGDGPTARRLKQLSKLMDSSIRLPGGFRIGLDGLIGLIPGFGDLAGAGVSAYIVLGAARLGAPKSVIARMLANVAIETVVGAIPIVGDVFDLAFKANSRNMRLLDRHSVDPKRVHQHSRLWFAGVIGALLLMLLITAWAILAVLGALFGLIF